MLYRLCMLELVIGKQDFSRNFSKGGKNNQKACSRPHKSMWPRACFSLLQDLFWKLVNMFTNMDVVCCCAYNMYVQHIQILKGGKTAMKGGEDSLPWPYVEKNSGKGCQVIKVQATCTM